MTSQPKADQPWAQKTLLQQIRDNHYIAAAVYVAGITLLLLLLAKPLQRLEDITTDLRFAIRGERPMDSTIVALYLDNEDIEALGGWPLRRNYYALLLDALHDVGARAVAMDIYFGERNPEFADYDRLLSAVTERAGNVVYACYFQNLGEESPVLPLHPSEAVSRFLYMTSQPQRFIAGFDLNTPIESILSSAAGLGETNLFPEPILRHVPLFVNYREALFPSLSFEALRVFYGASQNAIHITANSAVIIDSAGVRHRIPFASDGTVTLNYCGSTRSLNAYRFVEFLQSYDAWKHHQKPTMAVDQLKGKIVLVGLIAEGRSRFIATPFDPKYPSIGIHATILDNALNNRFLSEPSAPLTGIIAFVLGYTVFILAIRLREKSLVTMAIVLIAAYSLMSLSVFLFLHWVAPIVIPTFTFIGGTLLGVSYKHRVIVEKVLTLEEEKRRIQMVLSEKEEILQSLEQELVEYRESQQAEQPAELFDRLRKYHAEIEELSTQAADLEEYHPSDVASDAMPLEFEGIIYTRSSPMVDVVNFIKKIVNGDSNVLILGESGTGKELVARAIHHLSSRAEKPFVAVNCGALSETLLESELFGHERGAFTGAIREKPGRFELANNGTIFLDEIAETSEAFQVKLLRILQEGEFERVGGTETRKVNVRVIAATNRDLKAEMEAKRFREDLYYRLNVFNIQLPPLRERRGDIPALAIHFVRSEDATMGISANVMDALLNYPWRGNVRELESVMKRAVILAKSEKRNLIRIKDLPEEFAEAIRGKFNIEERILRSLREKQFSRNAISETASELGGLNRGTVAEYFRGILFKTFSEQTWDLEKTARVIAGTEDPRTLQRVKRKAIEYLSNAVEPINREIPFAELRAALKPKFKNLPQRYHIFLEEVMKSYYDGIWSLDETLGNPLMES